MPVLMIMTLAGSIFYLSYLFLKKILGPKIRIQYYMFLLKCSVFFYLCPFQFLKYVLPGWLLDYVNQIFGEEILLSLEYSEVVPIKELSGQYTFFPKYVVVIYFLCFFFALFFAVLTWKEYFRNKKELMEDSMEIEEEIGEFIKSNSKFSKLSSIKFKTYVNKKISTPIVVGIFFPKIIFPYQSFSKKQNEIILSHELTHVLHHDIIWKFLIIFVSILHWYNPLVYWLLKDFECDCEYYCDEVCTYHLTKEEKKEYAILVVHLSAGKLSRGAKFPVPILANGFAEGKEYLKNRIDFIVDRKNEYRFSRMIRGVCLFVSLFLVSLTIFLYEAPIQVRGEMGEFDYWNKEWEMKFSVGENYPTFLFDRVEFHMTSSGFLDRLEHRFIPPSAMEERETCRHTYFTGNQYLHERKGKGCKITEYSAKICSKCGQYERGEEKLTSRYAVCPYTKK